MLTPRNSVTVPTHLPLGFELNAKYQSSSMRGAMLVCGTDVIRWRCTNAHATSRWALQNPARRRRQFGEALLYYDFYIVTTTLNTRGTFTVAWQHRQQNAGASFEVEVYKIGHVGAGAERWLDEGSEAWNRTRDDQVSELGLKALAKQHPSSNGCLLNDRATVLSPLKAEDSDTKFSFSAWSSASKTSSLLGKRHGLDFKSSSTALSETKALQVLP